MNSYIKPLLAGGLAAGADILVMKRPPVQAAAFGGAVAAGTLAASLLSSYIPNLVPIDMTSYGVDGKTLSTRVVEVGLGAGASYAVIKYALKMEESRDAFGMRVGIILASGFVAEYLDDYIAGRALSYMA
jgi:hypothetical protein